MAACSHEPALRQQLCSTAHAAGGHRRFGPLNLALRLLMTSVLVFFEASRVRFAFAIVVAVVAINAHQARAVAAAALAAASRVATCVCWTRRALTAPRATRNADTARAEPRARGHARDGLS